MAYKPETLSKVALAVSIAALAVAIIGFHGRCHKKHDGGPHFGPHHEDFRDGRDDFRKGPHPDRDDRQGGPRGHDDRRSDKDGDSKDNGLKSKK
jgi:hypothetical protein